MKKGVLFVVVLSSMVALLLWRQHVDYLSKATVHIGEQIFHVLVADNPIEQQRGLSGQSQIPEDGMLFVFHTQQTDVSFWMQDMRFPLDIIWISKGKIIGIERNVPVPTQGEEIPTRIAPGAITEVLELSAGASALFHIEDTVNITY